MRVAMSSCHYAGLLKTSAIDSKMYSVSPAQILFTEEDGYIYDVSDCNPK